MKNDFKGWKTRGKIQKHTFFYLSFVNDFLYIFPCFFSKYNLKSNHNIPQIIDLKISSFFCDSCDFLSFFFICGFFCNEYNCIFFGTCKVAKWLKVGELIFWRGILLLLSSSFISFFLLWKTRKAEIREKERFEYAKADLDKTFFFWVFFFFHRYWRDCFDEIFFLHTRHQFFDLVFWLKPQNPKVYGSFWHVTQFSWYFLDLGNFF